MITLIFFGIISIGSDLISIPFSLYKTFVIEEEFGFNKTNKKTFFLDKLKGLLMTIFLGGAILALITWFYEFRKLFMAIRLGINYPFLPIYEYVLF